MSKWDAFGDRDFDGDVDFTDRLIEDEEFEELLDAESKRASIIGELDDEIEDDGILLDADIDMSCEPHTTEIVIPITVTVGVDIDDETPATELKFAPSVTKYRIPSDFITRNREKEAQFGIADMRFYAYWMPGFKDIMLIVGELITKGQLTKPFELRATVLDEEGDKIIVEENFSYTGGSGLVVTKIYPNIGFNRYPFQHEIHISAKKLKKCTFKLVPVAADDAVPSSIKPVTIAPAHIDGGVSIPSLKQYDKFPKNRVRQIHQPGTGLSELNLMFFKEHEYEDDEYFANQLSVKFDYSGKIKTDLLMYILIYNDRDELINFALKRLDSGDMDEEEDDAFMNIPHGELVSRIDVVTTTHPIELYNPKFF